MCSHMIIFGFMQARNSRTCQFITPGSIFILYYREKKSIWKKLLTREDSENQTQAVSERSVQYSLASQQLQLDENTLKPHVSVSK